MAAGLICLKNTAHSDHQPLSPTHDRPNPLQLITQKQTCRHLPQAPNQRPYLTNNSAHTASSTATHHSDP